MKGPTGTAKELHDWIVEGKLGRPISKTGNGHIKYRLNNGAIFYGPTTSSKPRTLYNGRATVRRLLRQNYGVSR